MEVLWTIWKHHEVNITSSGTGTVKTRTVKRKRIESSSRKPAFAGYFGILRMQREKYCEKYFRLVFVSLSATAQE